MKEDKKLEQEKYVSVFDRMLDMEKREAFLERKKSSYNAVEEEIEQLEAYILSDRCTDEILRLKEGDFFFKPPELTMLRKKNSTRKRRIYRFRDNESMLLKLMAFVMHDFDYLFSDSLYSFRLGMHISGIFNTVNKEGYNRNCWVLKTDIHSYGDNVDPDILSVQMKALLAEKDPTLFAFLEKLVCRGEYWFRGNLIQGPTGALSGCALTNFFENVYLLDVDDVVRQNSVYYCRFADDIAVFTGTRAEAEEIRDYLKTTFEERGLEFNENKTEICAPGEGFDLLGFRLADGEYDIAENSLEKIEWKLRHYADKLLRKERRGELTKEEAMQRMIDRVDRYFFGVVREERELNWVDWAFRILTRNDSLKRIDTCSQECIRLVGSGGKRTGAKYRVRYKDMRRMGYRTLVHAYYHGFERRTDEEDKEDK